MPVRKLKNRDAAEGVYRAQALLWGVGLGLTVGIVLGALVAIQTGNVLLGFLVGPVLCTVGVGYGSQWIANQATKSVSEIYNPSGETTPHKHEYSYEKSLVARGRYEEALAAFELAAIEHPDDPDPYFEAARLCKNELNRPEEAIAWYRRARADAHLSHGQEFLAMQEIVELYVQKLKNPRRAIPELSMLAERFPNEPAGQAARHELVEIREMLAREHQGFETFTEQFLKKIGRKSLSQAAGLTREELERQLITEALQETGGDRTRAAERLGITLEKLDEAMRALSVTP
jgi:tetratricopeptide (TPR) repeat protein